MTTTPAAFESNAALPSTAQWLISTPRRVWIVTAVAFIVCVILVATSVNTLHTAGTAIDQMRSARLATGESKVLADSVKTIADTLSKTASSTKPNQQMTSDAIQVIEEQRASITKSLDVYQSGGVTDAQMRQAKRAFDSFLSSALDSVNDGISTAEVQFVTKLGNTATTEAAQLNPQIDKAADDAANSAKLALNIARAVLGAIVLIAIAAPLFAVRALNLRNRIEVAQVAKALEDLGRHAADSHGLDPRNGPINTALATPFGIMTTGVRVSMERLEVWARTSDVERFIAESMESVRSRGDISGAAGTSFSAISATLPMELMVLSPDGSRMLRVASNPDSGAPGCPVASPRYCPAMRSTDTLKFPDALAPDVCPQLRARGRACAAACIPVKSGNQRMGVIHVTAPTPADLDEKTLDHLETVADLSGAKLSQVKAFEATWRRATTDQLTGLHNRRAFEDRANELIARQIPFILVMADLDHFKQLNDSYGHKTGDEALKAFARVLRENIRRSDMAARFGGEEFLVLLPEVSMTEALVTLDRVRLAFGPTLGIGGLPKTTASFGVARSDVATSLEGVIRVADAGVYLAKQNGRDRVETADANTVEAVFGTEHRRSDKSSR